MNYSQQDTSVTANNNTDTSTNTYYGIHRRNNNHLRMPHYMLADRELTCIFCVTPYTQSYDRIFIESLPTNDYYMFLINPTNEELSYLVLAGIKFSLATHTQTISIYTTLIEEGIWYAP